MLELKNIRKSYRTKDFVQNALNKVSVSFRENEFVSILGASGSGKTTMLNIIGGLDRYDEGDLIIEGISTKKYKSADWDAYRNSRVGFIFQSYNLIPHQTALANVELALTLSGVSANERRKRAIEALEEVGLGDHIHKRPTQLSGGQMQRVAIARALINDPEIILADEPTGALDSTTADQVMDLLVEIAKDRLIIMVTHNPELADKYTNRIIQLKDGIIIGDTNPYTIKTKDASLVAKATKTKMSFLTAVSLSVSNLLTKKGRTIITAIAGSIGILGIASILALASGINNYIDSVEEETMSAFPLSIDSSGIDITSFLGGEGNADENTTEGTSETIPEPAIDEQTQEVERPVDEVPILNTVTSLFSFQNKNDLRSFKEHLETNQSEIDPYVKNIQYKYGITPQIYLENEADAVRQVNPDTVLSQFNFGSPAGLDLISGAGDFGRQNFNELPGDISLFEDQYDVLVGKWATEINEIVVVLTDSGSLTDTTMYALGLKDREDLKNMFENFVNDENIEVEVDKKDKINFQEIMDVTFKLVNPAEKYTYDDNFNLWVDRSEDKKYMDAVIESALELEVVGIVRAKPDTNNPVLSSGLHYSSELTQYLITEAARYDIVQQQIEDKELNVFTGKRFDDEQEFAPSELFNLEDFITVDQEMIQNAFSFDQSALNINFSNFNINVDASDLPALQLDVLAESIATQVDVPVEEIQVILVSVLQDFVATQNEQQVTELEDWVANFEVYIESEEVQAQLIQDFEKVNSNANITQTLIDIVQNYFTTYISTSFNQLLGKVQADVTRQFQAEIGNIAGNIQNAVNFDTNALTDAFQFNIEEDEFFNLISSFGQREQISQSSNLNLLGYRDLDDPTTINLYPKDFTTKESVVKFIEDYNTEKINAGEVDKVVNYTDLIAAILSSVTTIIDTISYALVAFVSISLVVSSIMIGVITYVSVLERIKEIGILRAIGASKKDIRRVFNAETLIIGFAAGTFGILVTYGISIIANIIVYNQFNIPNIANLQPTAVGVLIGISMFLAFVSGLIPSSSAANKDPVEALRSE